MNALREVFLALGFIIAAAASAAGQGIGPQGSGSQQPAPALQLSMEQAVPMALETNLGLNADRLSPSIVAENVAAARAVFRPQIRSNVSRNTADSLPGSFTDANISVVQSGSTSVSSAIVQNLAWYGGGYSLS